MIRLSFFLFLLILTPVQALMAQPAEQKQALASAKPDAVVARVDGAPITLEELDAEVKRNPGFAFAIRLHQQRGGLSDGMSDDLRRESLSALIENRLMEKDAIAIGALTKEELDKRVSEAVTAQQGQAKQMGEIFAALNISTTVLPAQIRQQLVRDAYLKKIAPVEEPILEKEMRDYFEKNRASYEMRMPGMVMQSPPINYEMVKTRVEADMKSARSRANFANRMAKLRAEAKIDILFDELQAKK